MIIDLDSSLYEDGDEDADYIESAVNSGDVDQDKDDDGCVLHMFFLKRICVIGIDRYRSWTIYCRV